MRSTIQIESTPFLKTNFNRSLRIVPTDSMHRRRTMAFYAKNPRRTASAEYLQAILYELSKIQETECHRHAIYQE